MARIDTDGECEDNWTWIRWEGALKSALRGRPGQAALRKIKAALLALPEPRLIAGELACDGQVCALGALLAYDHGVRNDLNWSDAIDKYEGADSPEYIRDMVKPFGIAGALADEIMIKNDEAWVGSRYRKREADLPEDLQRERFHSMMRWLDSVIIEPVTK